MESVKLLTYFTSFIRALSQQLIEDEARWGNTWRYRSREGQVDRMFDRIKDYRDQHRYGSKDFPWLKAAGEMFIGWVRDNYGDWELSEEDEDGSENL